MEIVLASHNKKKIKELDVFLSDMLGGNRILTAGEVGIDDIEENGATFEENSLIKARAVWKAGRLTIADDSGLCVNALNGAPGVYSARYAGEHGDDAANNTLLLKNLEDKSDRSGAFVCAIACVFPDGREICVRGETAGVIIDEYRGKGGFGYDPFFLYEPMGKTFSEMSAEEKNSISHRGKAIEALARALKSN